jgi:uncharacterized protein YkwD
MVTVVMLAASVSATVGTMAPAAQATLRREKMLSWVNHTRTSHGLHALKMSAPVVELAHQHNLQMASQKRLFHTDDLGYKLRYVDWHTWGENVGAGVDPYGLYKAYMASPDHRANMLGSRFDRVGINFVVRHGIMWSTMIFYG